MTQVIGARVSHFYSGIHAEGDTNLFENRGRLAMAYVIAELCIGMKDTACVDVCPCDCIHPTKEEREFAAASQLYINPDDCVDCGACIPACPVSTIYPAEDLPEKWNAFASKNAEWYTVKSTR